MYIDYFIERARLNLEIMNQLDMVGYKLCQLYQIFMQNNGIIFNINMLIKFAKHD